MHQSSKSNSQAQWNFYIDTGGTFTDCIAVDPKGNEYSCKVLSSSALRGTVSDTDGSNKVKVKLEEQLPDDFFTGFTFLLLDNPDLSYRVIGFNSETYTLTLNKDIHLSSKESSCELRSPEEAPILATRIITQTPIGRPFPPLQMRLSTTKGTNALLERSGAKTLFLITEGFRDLLHIKNQQRPDLFALNIHKTDPFYRHIVEVPERINSDGEVIKPIDTELLKQRIKPFLDDVEAVAICLMNSYKNPDHENRIEEILHESDVQYISKSSALSPKIKIVPRAVTTDVNAYLTPIMEQYLNRISEVIQGHSLRVMSSGGNLVEANHYQPKDGLLSGPAGGVIGAVAIAKRVTKDLQGLPQKQEENVSDADHSNEKNLGGLLEKELKIISFDMGGTSSDVSRFDGDIDYVYEHSVGDATLSAPAVDIETVAAGGGSICGFDGQSLTVGPESAGADPGPACYGRGGPLTITDVNLLSGRLSPENFHISIVLKAAEKKLLEIQNRITEKLPSNKMTRAQILNGFLDIANERMAQAIRKISIQKGFDPADYSLVAFGGAGAQHALAIARKLNMGSVLIPSDAGLLSAYGLRQAKLEQIATRQILKPVEEVKSNFSTWFDKLIIEAKSELEKQGVPEDKIEVSRQQLFLRLKGQDSTLEIDYTKPENIKEDFKTAYTKHYGHWIENREIEVETIRVKVSEKFISNDNKSPFEGGKKSNALQGDDGKALESTKATGEYSSPFQKIYHRENLQPGRKLTGPALILDPHSTTVIEKDWKGELLRDGTWMMKDYAKKNLTGLDSNLSSRPEAVNLQLYTNRFRSVADQMGEMLRKTSMSVNVKERLDFSCALLDADGYLVVNAPHIPVHLGAMGTCVRTLIEYFSKGKTTTLQVVPLKFKCII